MLAVLVMIGAVSTAQAHALPGSVLTFIPSVGGFDLSVTLPVHDLAKAAPELEALEQEQLGSNLSPKVLADMEHYFQSHIGLTTHDEDLRLSLQGATLSTAQHEDVGDYRVLEVIFSVPVLDANDALALSYDAVMHEIRNHRARVLWKGPDQNLILLAEFGVQHTTDTPTPVILSLP